MIDEHPIRFYVVRYQQTSGVAKNCQRVSWFGCYDVISTG